MRDPKPIMKMNRMKKIHYINSMGRNRAEREEGNDTVITQEQEEEYLLSCDNMNTQVDES